jgi:hypothetical protein
MKLLIAVSLLGLSAITTTSTATAQGRKICNHDPVCQAERDGISVATARKRDQGAARCFSAAGVTEEQWRAYQVDTSKAPGIRACLARVRRIM